MKAYLAIIPALALGACVHTDNRPASVAGGECAAFEAPTFVVKGARRKDQGWIDTAIEAGIAACGWDRPKAEKIVRNTAKRSWGL